MHFVPRPPSQAIRRTRLDELIDLVDERGLAIIRGPAGSGKTATMISWASTRSGDRGHGVWITLDPSTSDRVGFWRHIFETLVDAGIPVASPAAEFIAVDQPIPDLQQRLVRAFVGLRSPITIVVDDFHHVDGSGVDADVAMLLHRAPRLRVVIGTRSRSELESPHNQVRLEPIVIGPDDLLFTLAETEELVGQILPHQSDLAADIYTAVGGWAIATRLVLLEIERAPEMDPTVAVQRVVAARSSADAGAAFLTQEPDSGVLRFALQSALADSVPFALAATLADGVDYRAAITWFEREGLGSIHPDDVAATFRWQPLVQAALRNELSRRYPEAIASTHSTIARWHLESGHPMPAMEHAVAGDNWSLANSVIRRFFSDFMLYHQPELMALLESAPRGRLRSNLALVATLAILHYASPSSPAERRRALADFGISLATATMRQESRTERLWIYSSLMAAQRVSGRSDAALATAERIAKLAARFDAHERSEVRGILPLLITQVATTMLYANQSERAIEHLRLVTDLTGPDDAWSDIHAESMIAVAHALSGDTKKLRPMLEVIADRRSPQGWFGSYPASGFHLATALHALESFDVDTALSHLNELRNHAETIEHWPVLYEIEGTALLIRGVLDAGEDFSRRVSERQRRTPTSVSMRARVAAIEADLLTSNGQSARARALLGKYPATLPSVALATARVHLDQDAPEAALYALDHIAWPEGGNFRQRTESSLLRAASFARIGDEKAGRQAANLAIDLLTIQELGLPWMMVPRADATRISDLLGSEGRSDQRDLIGRAPDVFSTTDPIAPLTKREILVLHELNDTHQVAVIAERLYVSPNTVKSQLRSLYRKLGVNSRSEALAIAHERGLF